MLVWGHPHEGASSAAHQIGEVGILARYQAFHHAAEGALHWLDNLVYTHIMDIFH